MRDSTKKIVWKEEDDQAWETVGEPGGVDQQLLFVRHTKDETEGEQQQGGGTLGEQVSNSWGDQTVPHSDSFLNKLTICRWQKDEVAGMQGKARRPDGIKTVVKVEKGGRVHIGQESRARSVEGRGRRDLGPEIWDERKMTENGNRVLEGVHAGCRSLRSPIVVCRFHPFEQ